MMIRITKIYIYNHDESYKIYSGKKHVKCEKESTCET
jgi:hypothetical protein